MSRSLERVTYLTDASLQMKIKQVFGTQSHFLRRAEAWLRGINNEHVLSRILRGESCYPEQETAILRVAKELFENPEKAARKLAQMRADGTLAMPFADYPSHVLDDVAEVRHPRWHWGSLPDNGAAPEPYIARECILSSFGTLDAFIRHVRIPGCESRTTIYRALHRNEPVLLEAVWHGYRYAVLEPLAFIRNDEPSRIRRASTDVFFAENPQAKAPYDGCMISFENAGQVELCERFLRMHIDHVVVETAAEQRRAALRPLLESPHLTAEQRAALRHLLEQGS